MIDWLVNKIFSWDALREAIFDEVHMYDNIDKIINDPEGMKIGSSFIPDFDGWRSWSHNPDKNRYYFNDIPEESLMEAFKQLDLMENPSQPEYTLDEQW